MKIHDCLLNNRNGFSIGNTTLGKMVATAKKQNLWDKRPSGLVDTVVIHYMSAVNITPGNPYDMGQLLKIFCDYGVSCHYLITREGDIFRLVPEEAKAWHCGPSIMPDPDNRTGVNDFSIGIELAATADSGFTDAQYRALRELSLDIEKRHGMDMNFVGHDQIAGKRAVSMGLRKEPKADPGRLFDWEFFAGSLR
ncbi:MAG: N-acetylmuramoyl-L-alanine amidase [Chitinispirillales bacterium]|jgi:N-acetyl-anhydromuramyl-L-alanine amidase AmpD|nr:N-acetylmuramoyl-L-alanine amidase [Chitinispirillales bacterium]